VGLAHPSLAEAPLLDAVVPLIVTLATRKINLCIARKIYAQDPVHKQQQQQQQQQQHRHSFPPFFVPAPVVKEYY